MARIECGAPDCHREAEVMVTGQDKDDRILATVDRCWDHAKIPVGDLMPLNAHLIAIYALPQELPV